MPLTMLVTLDGSEWAEGILNTATRVAAEMHAKVILLRIFPPVHVVARTSLSTDPQGPPNSSAYAGIVPPETNIRYVESMTQAAQRATDDALQYLQSISGRFEGLEVDCVTRESAHPAEEILSTAESRSVDLIATATHGRTGVRHVLLGSVAEAIVRSGEFPVLPTAHLQVNTPLGRGGLTKSMVRSIRGLPLPEGYRGQEPADLVAIEQLLLRLSWLVEEIPEIVEIDLNPVHVLNRGQWLAPIYVRIYISQTA